MTESAPSVPSLFPPTPLLELRQLSCERDERILFSQLAMECYAGEVIQIIGPNGSGKTTLLRALAGISLDYGGEILWRGQALPQAQWEFAQDLIYIGHLPGIKKALTPLENLRWYLSAVGGGREGLITDALFKVGLYGYEDTPCYQLSAGQLRRVALARLHLTQASIWILDEPFTAIDKAGVTQLEQLLTEHTAAGGLVVLTSHQDLTLSCLKVVNLLNFPAAEEEVSYAQ